jgi:hypothetical protein
MENELSRRRVELIVKVLLDASKKVVAKVEYCLPKSDIGVQVKTRPGGPEASS